MWINTYPRPRLSDPHNTPPGRSTRRTLATSRSCAAVSCRWCSIVTPTTELNRASSNGSAVDIPFDHLDVAARARLFPARHFASSRSISTAVTRGAMRASARVVGPGPGPSSSRLSPRETAARASAGGFRASVFPLRAGAIVPMELIHSAIHRRWHPARCDASNRDVPLRRQA